MLMLDKSIRFVSIVTLDGKIIALNYSDSIIPLLSEKEVELSVMHAVIRMSTRKILENKMGRALYSFSAYEKVKRATIALFDDSENERFLLISFDVKANEHEILFNKVYPFLKRQSIQIDVQR